MSQLFSVQDNQSTQYPQPPHYPQSHTEGGKLINLTLGVVSRRLATSPYFAKGGVWRGM